MTPQSENTPSMHAAPQAGCKQGPKCPRASGGPKLTPLTDTGNTTEANANVNLAAMQATLKRLEAELLREKKVHQDLQRDMESQAAQQEQTRDEGGEATTPVARNLEEELTQERLANAELQKALDDMVKSGSTSTDAKGPTIPRPKGSASTHFSIQVAMKLASLQEKDLKYKAIQRGIHFLALNVNIDWKLTWSKIPALAKANLYSAAREKHKYLKCFENDWATEELAKMYFKNIHGNHYWRSYLQVPEGYSHLKANSAQHNPSTSCIKKVKAVMLKCQEARARKTASKRAAEAEEPAMEDTNDPNPIGQDSEEIQVDEEDDNMPVDAEGGEDDNGESEE
ncbi:hypothetical protein ARMSODRAFT_978503 [Armillaria solidipes]|uniref:Uncharacterized protein n=1 Tax=Armillaria solidipes TaxID=1076256 RepID=A0A2H3BGA8_9AGAR|nr:hypothetical protein ARMSODRAFT_978503 [Armillaria solidipes]